MVVRIRPESWYPPPFPWSRLCLYHSRRRGYRPPSPRASCDAAIINRALMPSRGSHRHPDVHPRSGGVVAALQPLPAATRAASRPPHL
eukprot:scaffold1964_cov252-Isochrysis_galbana.AAC.21